MKPHITRSLALALFLLVFTARTVNASTYLSRLWYRKNSKGENQVQQPQPQAQLPPQPQQVANQSSKDDDLTEESFEFLEQSDLPKVEQTKESSAQQKQEGNVIQEQNQETSNPEVKQKPESSNAQHQEINSPDVTKNTTSIFSSSFVIVDDYYKQVDAQEKPHNENKLREKTISNKETPNKDVSVDVVEKMSQEAVDLKINQAHDNEQNDDEDSSQDASLEREKEEIKEAEITKTDVDESTTKEPQVKQEQDTRNSSLTSLDREREDIRNVKSEAIQSKIKNDTSMIKDVTGDEVSGSRALYHSVSVSRLMDSLNDSHRPMGQHDCEAVDIETETEYYSDSNSSATVQPDNIPEDYQIKAEEPIPQDQSFDQLVVELENSSNRLNALVDQPEVQLEDSKRKEIKECVEEIQKTIQSRPITPPNSNLNEPDSLAQATRLLEKLEKLDKDLLPSQSPPAIFVSEPTKEEKVVEEKTGGNEGKRPRRNSTPASRTAKPRRRFLASDENSPKNAKQDSNESTTTSSTPPDCEYVIFETPSDTPPEHSTREGGEASTAETENDNDIAIPEDENFLFAAFRSVAKYIRSLLDRLYNSVSSIFYPNPPPPTIDSTNSSSSRRPADGDDGEGESKSFAKRKPKKDE